MRHKHIFHFRTPTDMADELKQIAEKKDASTSAICRDAMSFYLSTGAWRQLEEKTEAYS